MQLKKVKFATAKEVCSDIKLSEEVTSLITESITPPQFLEQLIGAHHYQDAIRFLSRALPSRESVWWACVSARHCVSEKTPESQLKVLELSERWVFKPTEENRYQVQEAADPIETDTPIYWSGMAAFWSGGSMAPADVPEVPAKPNMYALAASGAVILAGLSDDASVSNQKYELFLKQGTAIANGDDAKQIVEPNT